MPPVKRPTALTLLAGETRPSRVNYNEPKPRNSKPTPPDWLPPDVLDEWHRVVAELDAMGIAFAADRDVIVGYCLAVVELRFAYAALAESGPLVPSARGEGMVKNPAVQVVRDASMMLRAFARELGLTPSARASLHLGEKAGADHAARLLS